MIIICCGIDKVGKSTLALKLTKHFKAAYIHTSAPKTKNPCLEYLQLLDKLNPTKNYVLDRFHLGELPYGTIYRRTQLTPEKQMFIELALRKHQAVVIYCWQDMNSIACKFMEDQEASTKLEDVPKLLKLYNQALQRCILPIFRYRYSHQTFQEVVKFVRLSQPKMSSNLNIPSLGMSTAKVLLVGDRQNLNVIRQTGLKHTIFYSTSGLFLMRCLVELKLDDVFIINQLDLTKLNIKLITSHCLNVVALGNKASQKLNSLNVFCETIRHPQFAKRFYGQDSINWYLNELKRSIK